MSTMVGHRAKLSFGGEELEVIAFSVGTSSFADDLVLALRERAVAAGAVWDGYSLVTADGWRYDIVVDGDTVHIASADASGFEPICSFLPADPRFLDLFDAALLKLCTPF